MQCELVGLIKLCIPDMLACLLMVSRSENEKFICLRSFLVVSETKTLEPVLNFNEIDTGDRGCIALN